MNKKKIMAALLATVCLTSGVAAITACGGNEKEKPPVVTDAAPFGILYIVYFAAPTN